MYYNDTFRSRMTQFIKNILYLSYLFRKHVLWVISIVSIDERPETRDKGREASIVLLNHNLFLFYYFPNKIFFSICFASYLLETKQRTVECAVNVNGCGSIPHQRHPTTRNQSPRHWSGSMDPRDTTDRQSQVTNDKFIRGTHCCEIYIKNNNNNKAKRKKGITIIMACAHGRQDVLLGGSRVEGIDDRAMICKSMEPSAIQANIMATSCRALTNCWANCSLE